MSGRILEWDELEPGDVVTFTITGTLGLRKGVVEKVVGKYGRPEIRVTHARSRQGGWVSEENWPLLKDGDYILRFRVAA
jgi:hypothetical protein